MAKGRGKKSKVSRSKSKVAKTSVRKPTQGKVAKKRYMRQEAQAIQSKFSSNPVFQSYSPAVQTQIDKTLTRLEQKGSPVTFTGGISDKYLTVDNVPKHVAEAEMRVLSKNVAVFYDDVNKVLNIQPKSELKSEFVKTEPLAPEPIRREIAPGAAAAQQVQHIDSHWGAAMGNQWVEMGTALSEKGIDIHSIQSNQKDAAAKIIEGYDKDLAGKVRSSRQGSVSVDSMF